MATRYFIGYLARVHYAILDDGEVVMLTSSGGITASIYNKAEIEKFVKEGKLLEMNRVTWPAPPVASKP